MEVIKEKKKETNNQMKKIIEIFNLLSEERNFNEREVMDVISNVSKEISPNLLGLIKMFTKEKRKRVILLLQIVKEIIEDADLKRTIDSLIVAQIRTCTLYYF